MPTRARSVLQLRALASIMTTSSGLTDVIMAVDADDKRCAHVTGPRVFTHVMTERKPMLHILNEVVLANLSYYDIFGFTGDDVVYETPSWDAKVYRTLRHGIGVAYGDDGIQHDNLPTHPWFSADIVRALGYVCNPGQLHYYFDNCLKSLFQPLNSLYYLPEISTKHLHHSVVPGTFDLVYHISETCCYEKDRQAFWDYHATGLAADIAKLTAYVDVSKLTAAPTVSQTGTHTPST